MWHAVKFPPPLPSPKRPPPPPRTPPIPASPRPLPPRPPPMPPRPRPPPPIPASPRPPPPRPPPRPASPHPPPPRPASPRPPPPRPASPRPPPASPPPGWTPPPPSPASSVCGSGVSINVRYIGNSSCVAQVSVEGRKWTLTAAQASCTATLFPGSTCLILDGILDLYVTNEVNASAATFVQPRFDTALQALGLGNLATIGWLFFTVDHSLFPIPVDLAPVFGTTLRDVYALQVQEFGAITPTARRLVDLPGLVGLRRFVPLPGEGESWLQISQTALRDMTSFSGLVQPPSDISIYDNPQLSSLNGLQGLPTWTSDTLGPVIYISGNNLAHPSSVSALATLAGCPTTSLTGSTQIDVIGCAKRITTWPMYCAFVTSGTCVRTPPPRPPSPRRPPPSPPRPSRPPRPPPSPPIPPSPPPTICESSSLYIMVKYSGSSSCVAEVSGEGGPWNLTPAQASCTATLFPGITCLTFHGILDLSVSNEVNASAATFFQPRFDTALQALGLGDLATIGLLSIFVNHSPFPIPVNLAPVFGTFLRDVNNLQVLEDGNTRTAPRLVGLPGLVGLRRFVLQPTYWADYSLLFISGTALRDMTSFSGLVQPPFAVRIYDNPQLSSLNGLQGLATWTSDESGPRTRITGNNLTDPSSVSALATLAGCPTTSLTGSTKIDVVGCAEPITTWTSFCGFISSGTCT
eukprot:jgi/Botrbrau1/3758/Bobra.0363s0035.1